MRRIGAGTSACTGVIDFKRGRHGVVATVKEIEYDPNRSARIALIEFPDGEKRYILHPKGLVQGDKVGERPGVGPSARATRSRSRKFRWARRCTNVELIPGKGGQLARSAGTSLQVVAKEGEYVTLRMASTEMRMLHGDCLGTIGEGRELRARAALVGQGGAHALGRAPARRCAAR